MLGEPEGLFDQPLEPMPDNGIAMLTAHTHSNSAVGQLVRSRKDQQHAIPRPLLQIIDALKVVRTAQTLGGRESETDWIGLGHWRGLTRMK